MIITNNFLRLIEWRAWPMKYSYSTMIQWSKTRKKAYLLDTPTRIMGVLQFAAYSLMTSTFTVYLLYHYLFQSWSNGKLDIYDVAFTPKDHAMETLTHIMYAGYMAAIMLLAGLWSRSVFARYQIVEFINMNLDYISKYQEKYKDLLDGNSEVRKQKRATLAIMNLLAILSFAIPLCFGFALFLPVWPEYWIINEFLEIPFKFEWKFFPLMILMDVCILQAGDMFFWFDLLSLIYFQGSMYFIYLLEPLSICYDKRGSPKFKCRLGCLMDLNETMQLFDEQRLLTEYLNKIYGHWAVTTQHASFLMLTTLGAYICIRYPSYLLIPGFQVAPIAALGPEMLEYFEMVFITSLHAKSGSFLENLKHLTGKEKKSIMIKTIHKYILARRALQVQLAYPYYNINKGNFVAYQNQVVDFLVNLLVSTRAVR